MDKITYKEAYDKIINAYFKDEIQPMKREFCFCGTLAPKEDWGKRNQSKEHPYTANEYRRMEAALLFMNDEDYLGDEMDIICEGRFPEKYEDVLFEGMSRALNVLKQIHIERGETIDEPTEQFTKRQLQTV